MRPSIDIEPWDILQEAALKITQVAERGQTNTKVVIGVLEKRFFEKLTSDVSLSMKLDQYTLGI